MKLIKQNRVSSDMKTMNTVVRHQTYAKYTEKNSRVILPGRRNAHLTFVPQQWAGGYGLTNNAVGRLRLSTWVMRS